MSIALANSKAFSLVELLVIVAVVGLVATVSLPLISGIPNAAKKEKLEQDVAIVNNAINAYLASGGSADNLTEAGTIGALKQRVIGSMPAEMMGPQGPFLDPTVVTKPTDFGWSALLPPIHAPAFMWLKAPLGLSLVRDRPWPSVGWLLGPTESVPRGFGPMGRRQPQRTRPPSFL